MTKHIPKFPINVSQINRAGWNSRLPSKLVHFIVIAVLLITGLMSIGARDAFAKDVNVFNLPSSNLGMPVDRLSYTMGVGDLDGDGDFDYLARVWIDDDIDRNFKTITYAVRNDGVLLWEFHHNMTYSDVGGDPTWTVTLSVWDMDGDGKDEVMTQMKEGGTIKLVMLDGETGEILKSVSIGSPKKILHATIAYLDGVNPFLVISQGRNLQTTAYDKNLQQYWKLNDSKYYSHHSWSNIYTADVDLDGKDEIVNGALIIDHDGSVYLNGSQWDHPAEGEAGRSIVADIDPDNPGMEWYLIRTGTFNDPYRVQPNYWEGPYLIDLDKKEIIWHHNLDVKDQGWGRMHRGWVHDVDPSPGLEMFATGYFWEGNEWQKALNGDYGTPPDSNDVWVDGYSETWFLYAADGTILRTQTGTYVGYPLFWDDDETAEYYRYRGGSLLNKFKGSNLESGFAQAHGSGESIQADVMGDWREEIIVASGYKLYIYSNSDPSSFPNRPSPLEDHTYRVNLASYGTGLPKPLMSGCGGSITPQPTFVDVPFDHWAHNDIETLYQAGYVAGCSSDPLMYCPENTMIRAESAVFVERGVQGSGYMSPYPTIAVFDDVPLGEWYAKWANGLWDDGYTAGCGNDPLIYCPLQEHTRTEGTVFFLRMLHGTDYEPPAPTGIFADVPIEYWGARWIEAAYSAGIIPACESDPQLLFCPYVALDRAMAAHMMVLAKGLGNQ